MEQFYYNFKSYQMTISYEFFSITINITII